jgi:hypothetical protein
MYTIPIDIPIFPVFKRFTINDKFWYNRFILEFEPYADFEFNNLLVWQDLNDNLEISRIENTIIFRYTDSITNTHKLYYSIIGKNCKNQQIIKILNEESQAIERIDLVPNSVSSQLTACKEFKIERDINNDEYIISLEKISNLYGSEYRHMRRDVNSFKRLNGDNVKHQLLELSSDNNKMKLLNALHGWGLTKKRNNNDPSFHEGEVIRKILSNSEDLKYKCLAIYINNSLESFVLFYEMVHPGYVITNSVKVNYKYRDLFDYTIHTFANLAIKNGIKYLNFEQDLGIQGIRSYKSSLKPIKMLKKYTIKKLSY